jgi:hypothetical protein
MSVEIHQAAQRHAAEDGKQRSWSPQWETPNLTGRYLLLVLLLLLLFPVASTFEA